MTAAERGFVIPVSFNEHILVSYFKRYVGRQTEQ